jgi:D-alanyl-D-alanine carboxypeptidase
MLRYKTLKEKMIQLNFNIVNPRRTNKVWNILWSKYGSITENKAWEFNGYRTGHTIDVEFELRVKGDHAGARIMLVLLGFGTELHLYDIRHWDKTQ